MSVNERSRHVLFEQLEAVLDPESAETLMELLPPVGWADVATKDDVHQCRDTLRIEIEALGTGMRAHTDTTFASLGAQLRAEMAAQGAQLRAEMAGQGAELRGEMRQVRDELKSEIDEVRAEARGFRDELKSEIQVVRAEIGDVRAEIGGVRAEIQGVRAELADQGRLWRDDLATQGQGFQGEHDKLNQRMEKLIDKVDSLQLTTVITVAGFTLTVWLTILVPPLFR